LLVEKTALTFSQIATADRAWTGPAERDPSHNPPGVVVDLIVDAPQIKPRAN
jgi:hypothetical protein